MNYLKISALNQKIYNNEFKFVPNRLTPSKIPQKYLTWLSEAHKKWLKHIPVYHNFDVIFVGGE